jgi:hypothetical protein
MKCANCEKPAMFEYRLTETNSIFYCGKDLPGFLEERKKAGLLTITEAYKDAAKTALEAVAYEAPKPTATAKKKTTKKSDK